MAFWISNFKLLSLKLLKLKSDWRLKLNARISKSIWNCWILASNLQFDSPQAREMEWMLMKSTDEWPIDSFDWVTGFQHGIKQNKPPIKLINAGIQSINKISIAGVSNLNWINEWFRINFSLMAGLFAEMVCWWLQSELINHSIQFNSRHWIDWLNWFV